MVFLVFTLHCFFSLVFSHGFHSASVFVGAFPIDIRWTEFAKQQQQPDARKPFGETACDFCWFFADSAGFSGGRFSILWEGGVGVFVK